MRSILRRLLVGASTAAMLGSSAIASAQAPDQRAAAQLLFEQGKALVERKSFAEACPKFAESLKLDRGLGTMLWLADCYENNGQTASAWATFKEAAAAGMMQKDAREKIARERAAALEKKLSRLQIVVPPELDRSGLTLTRDGVTIGRAEYGLAVPVDPGIHVVAATAPGRKSWSTNASVPAREQTVTVSVPSLEPAPEAKAAPRVLPEARAEVASTTGSTQRAIGFVLGGIGIAGVGVGAVFGLQAKSTYDHSVEGGHCLPDNRCDATGKLLRREAESDALVATIAMSAGAAALVAGGVLLLTAPKSSGVALVPSVNAHGGGALLHARF